MKSTITKLTFCCLWLGAVFTAKAQYSGANGLIFDVPTHQFYQNIDETGAVNPINIPYTDQAGNWGFSGDTLYLNGFTWETPAPVALTVTGGDIIINLEGDNVFKSDYTGNNPSYGIYCGENNITITTGGESGTVINEYGSALITALMNQSGLSMDEVIRYLDETKTAVNATDTANGLPEGTTFNKEITTLQNYLVEGENFPFVGNGSILNCASDALTNVISGVSKGILAMQALCADMSMGNFGVPSISNEQMSTSFAAIQAVEQQNGMASSGGYSINFDGFATGIALGEIAIIWVDGNHYITAIANADGTISVIDPNKNSGQAVAFSPAELKKLLGGGTATATSGDRVQGYAKVSDANGEMKVLTNSTGISTAATQINLIDMMNIRGAQTGGTLTMQGNTQAISVSGNITLPAIYIYWTNTSASDPGGAGTTYPGGAPFVNNSACRFVKIAAQTGEVQTAMPEKKPLPVTVYPNPAKDELTITAESPIIKVEIFSLDGKPAIQENYPSGKINISSIAKGVYIVKVYTGGTTTVKKLIKE